jgi:hypothetical protein
MWIVAGLLIALPAAAGLAGSYLLITAGTAAVLALCVIARPEPNYFFGWEKPVRAVAMLSMVAVFACAFGAYVLPEYPAFAAAGLVVVVAVIDTYWSISRLLVWVVSISVLAVAAWHHQTTASLSLAQGGPASWWRIALAVLVVFPVLIPVPEDADSDRRALGKFVVGVLLGAALTWAAVHRLGTGLSLTFVRDLVAGTPVAPAVSAVVVVVVIGMLTGTVALKSFEQADLFGRYKVFGVVAVAALTFAGPLVVMIVAGVTLLAYAAARFGVD